MGSLSYLNRFSLLFPQVAEMLGPGHVISTCLCDTGQVSDRSRDVSWFILPPYTTNAVSFCLSTFRDILHVSLVGIGWSLKVIVLVFCGPALFRTGFCFFKNTVF